MKKKKKIRLHNIGRLYQNEWKPDFSYYLGYRLVGEDYSKSFTVLKD